ncbi:MAG: hypothetical protein HYZ26_13525 [Chloroflexi bacterium]|nr:hypothetical protein [Chloroflexota bacterium]
MDEFDFKEEPQPRARRRSSGRGGGGGLGDLIWNLGTLYFLISSACLLGFVALIFMNPQSPYNPLPPNLQPTRAVPTLIPIPTGAPATATSPVVVTFTPTAITFDPTGTLEPSPTNFSFPNLTPSNTPSGQAPFFAPNAGDPTYIGHPDGCNGMYVGGAVFDINGAPTIFRLVRMTGAFGTEDAQSGTNTNYGESGYEIKISNSPQTTSGQVFLQILDDLTGEPLSDLLILNTFSDCSRNLILVNWTQTR